MRRLRLRRRLRLLRLLPPLPDRSVAPALAGAICVNFAISLASLFVDLRLPYETYDAPRALEGH